ncbi:DUF3087 domain-containing protein [Saccharobesus litoralis]|uniref:DUF3087 domain-containing protein n=1 Tax=Saccharobesus litoralis TaxID=2172099 RepID=A0A2S0VPV8_9ALTE|nr:DUF3087 family protein [Saccharobesus litoralis]AWB66120.1 DUF3087 domain-containing protein [Saccharobesus litoralis]
MQLKSINKQRYREHLNKVIVGTIAIFATLSLGLSTLIIQLFTDGEGTHFWINLGGVVLAMIIVWQILKAYQNHDYLTEIKYVWDLKQTLNLITRAHKKIQAGVDNNNPSAMRILLFSYKGSQQVYQLDDNTITMSELNQKIAALEEKMTALNLPIEGDVFQHEWLENLTS